MIEEIYTERDPMTLNIGVGEFDDQFEQDCLNLLEGYKPADDRSGLPTWPVFYNGIQINRKHDDQDRVAYTFGTNEHGTILSITAEPFWRSRLKIFIRWQPDVSVPSFDPELYLRNFYEWLHSYPASTETELGMEEEGKSSGQQPPATNAMKLGQGVPKRQLLNSNQWLIDQVFKPDNANLHQLRDEWLRRRREQDFKDAPNDPIRSMQTVIAEEKERRKRAVQ